MTSSQGHVIEILFYVLRNIRQVTPHTAAQMVLVDYDNVN